MNYRGNSFERDSEGRIIVDSFYDKVKKKLETRGKREKFWLIVDDEKVLFKKINDMTFEDYAEMLAEELYKQVGLPAATYDLAVYNGEKGVLTENFLGEDETLISGNVFITENLQFLGMGKLGGVGQREVILNNVKTIEAILKSTLTPEQSKKEIKKLYAMFGMYCMTLQGDIHWRNWSVLYNPKSEQRYKLSPLYDSAGMCRFSRGKNKLYGIYSGFVRIGDDERARKYVEESMFSEKNFDRDSIMKYAPNSPAYMGVTKLMDAFRQNPKSFIKVLKGLLLLDPEKAVQDVEKRIGTSMPDLAKNWFVAIINRNKRFLSTELSNYYSQVSNIEENNTHKRTH